MKIILNEFGFDALLCETNHLDPDTSNIRRHIFGPSIGLASQLTGFYM
jgi:hypothetical protein